MFSLLRQAYDNRQKAIQADLNLPVGSLSAYTFRHLFAINYLFQSRTLKAV